MQDNSTAKEQSHPSQHSFNKQDTSLKQNTNSSHRTSTQKSNSKDSLKTLAIILVTVVVSVAGVLLYQHLFEDNSKKGKKTTQQMNQDRGTAISPMPSKQANKFQNKKDDDKLTASPTTNPTDGWKVYNYQKKDFKAKSSEFLDYEYQGNISFKYPPNYIFQKTACRTAFHKEKGKYCLNVGGLNLTTKNDLEINNFLELFDLNNENQVSEFNRDSIISQKVMTNLKYDVSKLDTKLDLTPEEGFEGGATVYKVNTGRVGFKFTIRNYLKLQTTELKDLEKNILQIIQTIEVD